MLATHLGSAVVLGLLSALGAWLWGFSAWTVIGLYIVGGQIGLLASVMTTNSTGSRAPTTRLSAN
jgi:hypothetical protein